MTECAKAMDRKEGQHGTAVPLTRIFIDENGDLLVTDLWEPVRKILQLEENAQP